MLSIKMKPTSSVHIGNNEYMNTYFIDDFQLIATISNDGVHVSISQQSKNKVKIKMARKIISKLFGVPVSIQIIEGISSHVSHYEVYEVQ